MLLTPEEAAKFLKLSLVTIYKLCNSGELPAIKIGGSWRIKKEGILDKMK